MLKHIVHTLRRGLRAIGFDIIRYPQPDPIPRLLDPRGVQILSEASFQRSLSQIRGKTLLDVIRLANLWDLSKICGPGTILEVGSYRGGGALHLANANPEREVFAFDSFCGFNSLLPGLDDGFNKAQFLDTDVETMRSTCAGAGSRLHVVPGFFPQSAEGLSLTPVAFVHLDVDVYEATKASLDFLAPLLGPRSLIVLDDCRRVAAGVDRAIEEFCSENPGFRYFPIFSSQGILFKMDCWS